MATLAASLCAAAASGQDPLRNAVADFDPARDPWVAPVAARDDGKGSMALDLSDPDRKSLFRLVTVADFVAERKRFHGERYPQFVVPGAHDDFNGRDADNLGTRWQQQTGSDDAARGRRKSSFGIRKEAGRYPLAAGAAKPAAAVFNEELSATDCEVEADVTLDGGNVEFGLLLRAASPDLPGLRDQPAGEQWDRNSFVYVAVTTERISLRRRAAGKEGAPLAVQQVAAKNRFRLRFAALGKSLRVYRDGELVAEAEDPEPMPGRFAGVAGLQADGGGAAFDDFRAAAYFGELAPRQFAATAIHFAGPNVRHNPLYFEQRALERHGHHFGNFAQPFVAHGLFFVDCLLAPASVLTTKPWLCTSGDLFARPGDLVPFQATPPMLDKKAKFLNLALFAGLGFIVP